jgi:hypothetical protein
MGNHHIIYPEQSQRNVISWQVWGNIPHIFSHTEPSSSAGLTKTLLVVSHIELEPTTSADYKIMWLVFRITVRGFVKRRSR